MFCVTFSTVGSCWR